VRIAVLEGGRSLERQVSLRSGARVREALERLGHEPLALDAGADLVARLRDSAAEVAFVALHGSDGEDGTIQELLEVLGVPYTGSRPSGCVRACDKVLAKHLLRDAGIPTPDFFAFGEAAFRELGAAAALPAIESRLGFPIVVKPARQGSALGVRLARSADEVPEALLAAFSYDRRVLLERHVEGRDLALALLEPEGGGEPAVLPAVEAIPLDGSYDFEARYEIGRTRFECPAELPAGVAVAAAELASATWRTLGLEGFARVDMMLENDTGELFVLEADTVPGLTATSLVPQAAEAGGVSFERLVERLLSLAAARSGDGAAT